jgi:hypothetical protein
VQQHCLSEAKANGLPDGLADTIGQAWLQI